MAHQARPAPPPTPAANATGVVPRWRAWSAALGALVVGFGLGRYGVGTTVAAAVLAGFAGLLVLGLIDELRRQARTHEFDHIETRHQVARALQEGDL